MLRRLRRNHGLEHATIAVLLERGVSPPLAGNATPWGFLVYGRVSTEEVDAAVAEALLRMHAGHQELAVSPYCGTNLVVGAVLTGVLAGLAMRRTGRLWQRVPLIGVGLVGATLVRRPLGEMVQRRYTTLSDMTGVRVGRVRRVDMGRVTVHLVTVTHQANRG